MVRVPKKKMVQTRYYGWCLAVPPKCTKYRMEVKTVYENETITKTRPVEDCCKGYTKSNLEDICIPVCSNNCLHGTCVAPEKCKCEQGYGGPTCSVS